MNHPYDNPISSTILDSLTSNVPNVPMHPMNVGGSSGASTPGIAGIANGVGGGANLEDGQRCFVCGYGGCDIRISPGGLSVHAVSHMSLYC